LTNVRIFLKVIDCIVSFCNLTYRIKNQDSILVL